MVAAPVKPRNFLYTSITFALLGGWILYSGSEIKYTLIGFIPAGIFLVVFIWTVSTEKRF